MFNLIVGFTGGTADSDRLLEHTADYVKQWVKPAGAVDPMRLMALPTLLMPERGGDAAQVARLGHVEHFTFTSRSSVRFQFVPAPGLPVIPLSEIESRADSLDMHDWEFTRTHWAVKDVDVYGALMGYLMPGSNTGAAKDRVFKVPIAAPEHDLVAVMMPFGKEFDPVYDALGVAADAAGMRAVRADDIWIHDHVMDDIVNLIWRARVVISDLSGKNPNVFYETGLAHAWGRDVIMITRSADDVPFDLRSLRYIPYLPNSEGMGALQSSVYSRLNSLKSGF